MAALVFLFDNIIFLVICAFDTPTPKQALAWRARVLFVSDLIPGSSYKFLGSVLLMPHGALGSCLLVLPLRERRGEAGGRQAVGGTRANLAFCPSWLCVAPQVPEPIISGL